VRVLVQALVAAPGGSVTVLRDLVAAWPAEDDLLVVCWRAEAARLLADTGHPVLRIPARSTAEALVRLRVAPPQSLRTFVPDVVWSQAVRVGGIAAPSGPVPQAVHYRDIGSFITIHPDTLRQRLKGRRERSDLLRADLRVFNSEALRAAVHARHPQVAGLSDVVVHNGLDLGPILRVATAPTSGASVGTLRLLLPQGDAPHKRNPLAASVLAALVADPPPGVRDVRMTVVGAGAYADLRQALVGMGLGDRVRFTGYVSRDEMGRLYAAHHAVLMTGAAESFGNPVVEAHAAGRPIVSPPFAAAREVAGPLRQTAERDDAAGLAQALREVLSEHPDPARTEAARQFALGFQAETQAQRLRNELGALGRASSLGGPAAHR
jgi:glycosyltransferase involved in cell wall biosynthesis